MEALALTDRDGVCGSVEFYLACREAGVKPILGVELTEVDNSPERDRKSTRLNSSHIPLSRMPSSA